MLKNKVFDLISWLFFNGYAPAHKSGVFGGPALDRFFTEAEWDSYDWDSYDYPIDKPTWEMLLFADFSLDIENDELLFNDFLFDEVFPFLTTPEATAPVEHPYALAPVDLGGGVNHMAALLHHAQEAKAAGKPWPIAVLRDTAGGLLYLHTGVEGGDVFDPAAKQRNRASSAGNIVRARIRALERTARDLNGGLSEDASVADKLAARKAALAEHKALQISPDSDDYDYLAPTEALKTLYREALSEIDALDASPMAIPNSYPLDRLKAILVAVLEAESMAHIKNLRGAVSQQRIDMPPWCRDMGAAEERIAEEEGEGHLAILAAMDTVWKKAAGVWAIVPDGDTVPAETEHEGTAVPDTALGSDGEFYRQTETGAFEAKAAFSETLEKIGFIRAERVPVLRVKGSSDNLPEVMAFDTASVALTAKQPPLPAGRVAVVVDAGPAVTVRVTRRTVDEIDLALSTNIRSDVTLRLSNICGTVEYRVSLTPPPE